MANIQPNPTNPLILTIQQPLHPQQIQNVQTYTVNSNQLPVVQNVTTYAVNQQTPTQQLQSIVLNIPGQQSRQQGRQPSVSFTGAYKLIWTVLKFYFFTLIVKNIYHFYVSET